MIEFSQNKINLYERNISEGTHTNDSDIKQYIGAVYNFQHCYKRTYIMTDERFELIAEAYTKASQISTKNDRNINLPSFFELAKIGSMYFKINDDDTQKLLNLVKFNLSISRFNKISLSLQSAYT